MTEPSDITSPDQAMSEQSQTVFIEAIKAAGFYGMGVLLITFDHRGFRIMGNAENISTAIGLLHRAAYALDRDYVVPVPAPTGERTEVPS